MKNARIAKTANELDALVIIPLGVIAACIWLANIAELYRVIG